MHTRKVLNLSKYVI